MPSTRTLTDPSAITFTVRADAEKINAPKYELNVLQLWEATRVILVVSHSFISGTSDTSCSWVEVIESPQPKRDLAGTASYVLVIASSPGQSLLAEVELSFASALA